MSRTITAPPASVKRERETAPPRVPAPRPALEVMSLAPLKKRKLLVALGAVLFAFFLVEVAVRVRQKMKYGTAFAVHRLVEDPVSGLEIPVPGFELGLVKINSMGFRGPEIEIPKPGHRIRVAYLGGSTTFCAETSTYERIWPHVVHEGLVAAFPDQEFDYVNASVAGYSSTQSIVNLELRVAPLEPDVVVIYHGTNDLTQDSRLLAAEQGLFDPSSVESNWLLDNCLVLQLIEKNLRYQRRLDPGRSLQFDERELSRPFEERMRTLVDRGREIAPVVLVPTFANRLRREQSPEERTAASISSHFYMPYLDEEGLLRGFEEYNRVIRGLAGIEGVVVVEGEEMIPGDGVHFTDSVHLSNWGCQKQGARVLAGLLGSEEFAELVRTKREMRGGAKDGSE